MLITQNMTLLNEEFKKFFTEKGFKVRKEGLGLKATKSDVDLTFCLAFDCFSKKHQEEEGVDSMISVKIPYTYYELAHYTFLSSTTEGEPNLKILNDLFSDPAFLALIDWTLPARIDKKLI